MVFFALVLFLLFLVSLAILYYAQTKKIKKCETKVVFVFKYLQERFFIVSKKTFFKVSTKFFYSCQKDFFSCEENFFIVAKKIFYSCKEIFFNSCKENFLWLRRAFFIVAKKDFYRVVPDESRQIKKFL